MKSISVILKENLASLPYTIGRLFALIPFKYRPGLGSVYADRKKEIELFENYSNLEKKEEILRKMKAIVEYAYENVPFYTNLYDEMKFHPSELSEFSDIDKIPIINKAMLQKVDLQTRSSSVSGRYIVNTGGSSGKPLSFYITPDSMGHEWAHMHKIWETLGYKVSDLKISFGGRSSGEKILEYDSVRHSYNYNIYMNPAMHKKTLVRFFSSKNIKYLHGYPSAIYEFSLFCSRGDNADLLKVARKKIKGVFFGSEFPNKLWRKHIEETFDCKSVSWYGHTERAVLAFERKSKYEYSPFPSYGYAETLLNGNHNQLVSTAYFNLASPLIRYNTEDVIDPALSEDILSSFKITEGRIGEFVIDKNGSKIPLTGLIFGRHHKLFDHCSYLQVSQPNNGSIVILYTPLSDSEIPSPEELFDSDNVNIDISFNRLDSPIKTSSGKVNLLVKI